MTAESSCGSYIAFILGQLRVVSARANLVAVEANSIAAALAGNFISVDDAIAWAHDAGALDGFLTIPSSVLISTSAA